MMPIKKEAVPDDADLETFGAELVRMRGALLKAAEISYVKFNELPKSKVLLSLLVIT